MDPGIRGRKVIICGSNKELGKGCALTLAQAAVSLVVKGRNQTTLNKTVEEIQKAAGVDVLPVVADISTPEGQAAVLAALPAPDILIN